MSTEHWSDVWGGYDEKLYLPLTDNASFSKFKKQYDNGANGFVTSNGVTMNDSSKACVYTYTFPNDIVLASDFEYSVYLEINVYPAYVGNINVIMQNTKDPKNGYIYINFADSSINLNHHVLMQVDYSQGYNVNIRDTTNNNGYFVIRRIGSTIRCYINDVEVGSPVTNTNEMTFNYIYFNMGKYYSSGTLAPMYIRDIRLRELKKDKIHVYSLTSNSFKNPKTPTMLNDSGLWRPTKGSILKT